MIRKGQIIKVPAWKWVDCENVCRNANSTYEIGSNGGIDKGGTLKVLGWVKDLQAETEVEEVIFGGIVVSVRETSNYDVRVLCEYTQPNGANNGGANLPSGGLCYIDLEELCTYDEQFVEDVRKTEERKQLTKHR